MERKGRERKGKGDKERERGWKKKGDGDEGRGWEREIKGRYKGR